MTTCSLDTLMFGLRMAVMAADEAVRDRRESLLRGDESKTLQVEIPETPANDAPLTPVVLSLRSFRDPRSPRVTSLSVEFDVRFRQRRVRGESRPALFLDMDKPRFPWFSRRPAHRLRITYRAADDWMPVLELDGRTLDLPPLGGTPA
ncbi:MAG: hypothetical protein GAK28_00503 [Luteibacter sp.]|nr:MAG: hypothetical protein GAK28_00503 [Luteibacter sp.]